MCVAYKNMKQFKEEYKDAEYQRFKSDEIEIIIFRYIYGKSCVFIKHETDHFLATKSGTKSAKSSFNYRSEHIVGTNILTKHSFKKDFEIFTENDKAMLKWDTGFDMNLKLSSNSISDLEYEDLPVINIINKLLVTTGDDMDGYVLLTGRKYNYSHESATLHYFTKDHTYTKEIERFDTYRDGGTVKIKTVDGYKFHFPTPWKYKDGDMSTITMPNDEILTMRYVDLGDVPMEIADKVNKLLKS